MVPRKKTKTRPVTAKTTPKNDGSRKRKHAVLIRKFHNINKDIEKLRNNDILNQVEKLNQIKDLEVEKEKLGGINAYQLASLRGEKRYSGYNTCKWVLLCLKKFSPDSESQKKGKEKIQLLDVGALSENYKTQSSWINCLAIDLNPQHCFVKQQDFLDATSSLSLHGGKLFDVVVLSLVINFCGDAKKRGDFLKVASRITKPKGYLVAVLPLPCIDNSRYCDDPTFISLCKLTGFTCLENHFSKKLAFYFLQRTPDLDIQTSPPVFGKRIVRNGKTCNNFCIVLE